MPDPVVLYEDNHLLVLDKPVGMASQGALPEEPSAVNWARQYLKRKYAKPGKVFIGVVSRLDRDVSGVLVLARTSKAAARLNEQFRERSVEKIYWAVVEGTPPPAAKCVDWLTEDKPARRMVVADAAGRETQEAVLGFDLLRQTKHGALLEIRLETGRKHQIRVQLAARGWPIVGDRKYGSRRTFRRGIALHARQLRILHPVRREPMLLQAPCPATWRELGVNE